MRTATLLLIGGVVGFVAGVGVERRGHTDVSAPPLAAPLPSPTVASEPVAPFTAPPLHVAPAYDRAPTSSASIVRSDRAVVLGGTLHVFGRFANPSEAAAIRGARAMVEDDAVTATFRSASGTDFTVDVPTATLLPATHTVTLLLDERGGREARVATKIGFGITSPAAPSAPATGGGKHDGGIDVFAPIAVPQSNARGDVTLDRGGFALIEGWSYDTRAHRASSAVYVTVDRHAYRATTGVERPDVVATLGAGYARVGFRAVLGTVGLAAGTHVVGLVAAGGMPARGYAFPQTFRLTIR